MDKTDLEDLRHAVVQAWNTADVAEDALSADAILEALTKRVASLIRHDIDRLFAALYLIDVSEDRFDKANILSTGEAGAGALARAILDREIEKMESRKKYRREQSVDAPFRVEPDTDNAEDGDG